jgi:hypothetical protein
LGRGVRPRGIHRKLVEAASLQFVVRVGERVGRRSVTGVFRLGVLGALELGTSLVPRSGVRSGSDAGVVGTIRLIDGRGLPVVDRVHLGRLVRRDRGERRELGREAMELARLEGARRREPGRLAGLLDHPLIVLVDTVFVADGVGDRGLDRVLSRRHGRIHRPIVVLVTGVDERGVVRRDRGKRRQIGRRAVELARLEAPRGRQSGRGADRRVAGLRLRGQIRPLGDRGLLVVEEDRILVGEEWVGRGHVAGFVAHVTSLD